MLRLAFAGFRHNHILSLYHEAQHHPDVKIVAACEGHAPTADAVRISDQVDLTHTRLDRMLAQVDCDAVAIGDAYGLRGAIALQVLRAGRHVLSDKPLCVRLDELDDIQNLVDQTGLQIGCLFDLRGRGIYRAMRQVLGQELLGPVHTVTFTAQHPLHLTTRPSWYFEPGMQGGTLNDIAIHAMDLIPWLTERQLTQVVAARAWNARLPQYPFFQDAAQLMMKLDNGGGVLGDVSYLAPQKYGYRAPQYWRITCHASRGVVEVAQDAGFYITDNDEQPVPLIAQDNIHGLALDAFIRQVNRTSRPDDLTTQQVLTASRHALLLQQAADQNRSCIAL